MTSLSCAVRVVRHHFWPACANPQHPPAAPASPRPQPPPLSHTPPPAAHPPVWPAPDTPPASASYTPVDHHNSSSPDTSRGSTPATPHPLPLSADHHTNRVASGSNRHNDDPISVPNNFV